MKKITIDIIMNKYFLLLLFSLFLQNSFAQKFRAGITAGLVSTDVAGSDTYDNDNDFHKAGFTGGGILSIGLWENKSFQFELLYTQKGSLQPYDSINNLPYFNLRLNYIEVPLLFKDNVKFNIGKKTIENFAYQVGLSIGSLTKIKQDNDAFYGVPDYSQFRRTEIAGIVGFSYSILDNLLFDVRYSNSIMPVVKHPQVFNSFFPYTFYKGDNMVFYFTLRYIFNAANTSRDKG